MSDKIENRYLLYITGSNNQFLAIKIRDDESMELVGDLTAKEAAEILKPLGQIVSGDKDGLWCQEIARKALSGETI